MRKQDIRFISGLPPSRYRTEQEVDRDRVLYSPHMARLAEVTQVRTLDGNVLVHNRLTHSLKVGQLARGLASKLLQTQPELAGKLSVDLFAAEAAGLAHDMGHPPFGHIVEEELDELVRGRGVKDGYEGNAQTFRILTTLTVGDGRLIGNDGLNPGLNLTSATLNAVLKYPWFYNENADKPKSGAFTSLSGRSLNMLGQIADYRHS